MKVCDLRLDAKHPIAYLHGKGRKIRTVPLLSKTVQHCKQYLRKFRRQFAGNNYYVPQTVYELQDILMYLGGRHEPTDQSFHHYSRVSGRKLS